MKKDKNIEFSKNNGFPYDRINLIFPERGRIGIQGLNEQETYDFYQILLGFQKPSSGSVRIGGKAILSYSKEEAEAYRREKVGLLFKDSMMQISLNILENVEYPLWLRGEKNAKAKARKVLEDLGLSSCLDQRPYTLAEDNLQKASLARAIAKDSKIILANDPFSYLAKDKAEEIIKLLKEQSKTRLIILDCMQTSEAIKFLDYSILLENRQPVSNIQLAEKEEKKETEKERKSSLGFRHVLTMAWNHRKRTKALSFATIAVSSLALALSGVSSSLRLKTDHRLTADSVLAQKDDYCSLSNVYEVNGFTGFPNFSDSTVDALSKNLNLSFLKVIKAYSTIPYYEDKPIFSVKGYTGDSSTDNFTSYFERINNDYRYASLDSMDQLPDHYRLLTGRLPENENEIRLTDFQTEGIAYAGKNSNFDYDSLLGKRITLHYGDGPQVLPELTITGILDTIYDGRDFAKFKDYCIKEKDSVSSEKDIMEERERLIILKNESYINIFFVSKDVFNRLKRSNCFHSDAYNDYFTLNGTAALIDDQNLHGFEYLRDSNKKQIQLFSDAGYDATDFLSLSLPSYVEAVRETENLDRKLDIVIPKKFLEKGAAADFTYKGSAYDFFHDFIRLPIHTYSIDYYKDAVDGKKFDRQKAASHYYAKEKTEVPSIISETDQQKIYEYYLSEVFSRGYPDYESKEEVKSFTDIYSLGKERISYYRDYYKNSVFSQRKFSYHYSDIVTGEAKSASFTLSGLTLIDTNYQVRYPIRQQEILSKIYYDGGSVYDNVITPNTGSNVLRKLIEKQSGSYLGHYRYQLINSSVWGASDAIAEKNFLMYWFFAFSILFLSARIILEYFFLRKRMWLFSIDVPYQKARGTSRKDIRKESILRLLFVFLPSFFFSIAFRYIDNRIIKACIAKQYPAFLLLNPGYPEILILFFLSLLITTLVSLPSLLNRKQDKV